MRTLVGIKEVNPFPIYDISVKNDHCFELSNGIIAHNSMYPKSIVSGGTGLYYSANQIFIITKSQEKDGGDLAGWKFTINIEKSRYVKEKAKLPFTVLYDSGVQKWSSLFDLAMESGHIIKPKMGWYQLVDPNTGEVSERNYRQKDIEANDEFFETLVKDDHFQDFIEKRFKLAASQKPEQKETDEIEVDIEEE